jgi:hypothetical protein
MQNRLSSVQQALLFLLATGIAVALLARPVPENQRLRSALFELQALQAHFDRPMIERTLLESALAQGRQPLRAVAAASTYRLTLAPALTTHGAAVDPLATLDLSTLAAAQRFSESKRTLTIGVPDLAQLGESLAVRLMREDPSQDGAQLERVTLRPAQVDEAALSREEEVASTFGARAAYAREISAAQATLAQLKRDLRDVKARPSAFKHKAKLKGSKPPSAWQLRKQLIGQRKLTQATLTTLERKHQKLDEHLMALAEFAPVKFASLNMPPVPSAAVALVSVSRAGVRSEYQIPVRLRLREVPVPTLQGTELRETQSTEFWSELKDLTPARAIEVVHSRFNWHYRYSGMTLLQLLPAALPLLLALALMRIRAVPQVYNPFSMRVRDRLPFVGYGSRLADALALVVLPLTAALFAIASLMIVGQVPALPLLTGVIGLVLGVYAFIELGQLKNWIEELVRSHHRPPSGEHVLKAVKAKRAGAS